jgi:signal transduction histidine kinase
MVERQRSGGRAVTLHVEGAPGPMPASVDLAVYRILEEALASSGTGAAAADVVVEFGVGDVALTVAPATVAPLDWPTPAMRERAALCGGTAEVETTPGGAERLVVRLPCVFDEAVA